MLRTITFSLIALSVSLQANATEICQQRYHYSYDVVKDFGSDNEFVVCQKCQQPKKIPPLPEVLPSVSIAVREEAAEQTAVQNSAIVSAQPAAAEESRVIGTVHFGRNSSRISSAGAQEIDAAVSVLQGEAVAGANVVVTGYTCDLGSQRYNDALAVKRAESVNKILAGRNIHITEVKGKGKSGYLTKDKQHRVRNRRVEITVSGVADTHIKSTKGGQDHD